MSLLSKLKISTENDEENSEENEQLFSLDPEPGERPIPKKNTARKVAPPPGRRPPATTVKLAKEVAEDLATLLEGTAAVWGLQDQCCAPILAEQAKPIAAALTAILSRNPRLLAKFANTDIVSYTLQSVALGKALLPVGQAVYRNHVSRAVDDEDFDHAGSINLAKFPSPSSLSRPFSA